MDRTEMIEKIDEVLGTYCQDCFIKKHFLKNKNKTYAHRFCIRTCTIGENLQQYGQELLEIEKGDHKRKRM